jgi:hypothetical protein
MGVGLSYSSAGFAKWLFVITLTLLDSKPPSSKDLTVFQLRLMRLAWHLLLFPIPLKLYEVSPLTGPCCVSAWRLLGC